MADAINDEELVRAAQQGDVAALGLVLERHRAPLYAAALGMLGSGPEAQDAVTAFCCTRRMPKIGEP